MHCNTLLFSLLLPVASYAFVHSFVPVLQKRSSVGKLFCTTARTSPLPPPAYISRILELSNMTNNASQVARVNGGCSVVRKGDFQIGDLAVFIGLDSIVNINDPRFNFLHKHNGGMMRHVQRVRPYKLEGEMTYGVIGPLQWLETGDGSDLSTFQEGDDVSEILGVTKYIHPNEPGLATIERVKELTPISGKDQIALARVKGWECIVRKEDFSEGDLGVYLALDSVPDLDDPNFAFLKQKGLTRIKTMKLGGVISQGLLCPLSWLADRGVANVSSLQQGDNVAALIGVTKYIAEEEQGQYAKKSGQYKSFPANVPKTDATRIQTDPDRFLGAIADKTIVITRKEDGCSATFIHNHGEFTICGRNFIWNKPDKNSKHYFTMATTLDLEKKMAALGRNLAIQGELCGPDINKNRHKLLRDTYSVFDVFDIDNEQYLSHDDVCKVCEALGLSTVPLLYRGRADKAVASLSTEGFLKYAESLEYCEGVPAEGIVVKTDPVSAFGARTHFKVISNKYLLKHDL